MIDSLVFGIVGLFNIYLFVVSIKLMHYVKSRIAHFVYFVLILFWLLWSESGIINNILISQQIFNINIAKFIFVFGSLMVFSLNLFILLLAVKLVRKLFAKKMLLLKNIIILLAILLAAGLVVYSFAFPLVSGVGVMSNYQLKYTQFYGTWKSIYTLSLLIPFIYLFVIFLMVSYKGYLYLRDRIKSLLFVYVGTVAWSSFWSIIIPSILHSSQFSYLGTMGIIFFTISLLLSLGADYLTVWRDIINNILSQQFIIILWFVLTVVLGGSLYTGGMPPIIIILIVGVFGPLVLQVVKFKEHLTKCNFPIDDVISKIFLNKKDKGHSANILDQFLSSIQKYFTKIEISYSYEKSYVLSGRETINHAGSLIWWTETSEGIKFFVLVNSLVQNQAPYVIFSFHVRYRYIRFFNWLLQYVLFLRTFLYMQEMFNFMYKINIELENKVRTRTLYLEEGNRKLLQSNRRLSALYRALRTSDQAKTMFISIVSHQLRTPLSIIRNYIDMLESTLYGPLTQKQADILQRIKDAAMRLNNLVVDVLQSSRLERGKFSFVLTDLNIKKLVIDVVEQYFDMAKRKSINLKVHIDKAVRGLIIRGDKDKLFEAFSNILDNAIHYTPKGGNVDVYLYKANNEWIIYAVKDTGIGIPDDQKQKLFTKFTRLDNAKKVRPDGTGIGLYLVKRIIDGHDGKVWFKSKVGEGSTFYIALRTDSAHVEEYIKKHSINNKALHADTNNFKEG